VELPSPSLHAAAAAQVRAGLRVRDELALDSLMAAGAAVCVVLAGGYADNVDDIVDINAATAAAVAERVHEPISAQPRSTAMGCQFARKRLP
jgi:hypothetical protein